MDETYLVFARREEEDLKYFFQPVSYKKDTDCRSQLPYNLQPLSRADALQAETLLKDLGYEVFIVPILEQSGFVKKGGIDLDYILAKEALLSRNSDSDSKNQ